MILHQYGMYGRRSLAATLLCGVALAALCSCAHETQTPPAQRISASTPPPSTVTSAPPPVGVPAQQPALPHVAQNDPDLPNFHVVSPALYRGAAPSETGLDRLQKMGVKTVIDLRIAPKTVAKEHKQLDEKGIHFVNLPMSDQPPTEKQIQTFLATISDPAQQPVFVHCQHGADRTGTMIGIYRGHVDGWSYDKTYKEMRKYGFKPHLTKMAESVRRFAPTETAH